MKGFRELAFLAAAALIAGCSDTKNKEVPTGQISAKMINNPRSAAGSNPADLQQLPKISFSDSDHYFGTISAGEIVEHEFSFSNSGNSPLLIVGATSSCGCTVPRYPTAPIPPGGQGVIKVQFDSKGKQGHILKAITVNTNGNPPTRFLTITADVKP